MKEVLTIEYYIYITNDCNMNCSYCSVLFDTVKHGIPLNPQYSFADLEKFITNTQKQLCDDVADIYFFGGEPTVDYNCIKRLIYAMNKPHEYKINYIMHTNGLLISKAPQEIIDSIDLTLLSFNYELIYRDGHITDYFNKMIKAIKYIKAKKNTPVIGRITVSAKTSLFTECCLISNFVDYVYWQIDNCAEMPDYENYSKQYKYDIDLLFEYWMACLEKGIFLRFVPFMNIVKNCIFDIQKPNKFYCGYGETMIYVQTNGNCYACCDNVTTNSHYIGDIYSGVRFPEINLDKTVCKNCTYINLCGGRCGRMHKDFSPERISQYCELNIHTYKIIKSSIPKLLDLIQQHPHYKELLIDPMTSYTEYTS